MTHGKEVGLGPDDIVWKGTQLSSPKEGYSSPQFLARVYCGETTGWIRMPLGMEVGLGPGDIVYDGYSAPLPKGTSPTFRLVPIVTKRSPIAATAALVNQTC